MAKKHIPIVFIVILAFAIRISGLSLVPPSLNWDEVSHGYNAYSILKSARDEWGQFLPLIFRAYGDYKLPVYIYTLIPFIKNFGLTPLAIRLPSVLAGTFSVLFTYLLALKLFKKSSIAYLASFLLAISPWSFFLSRIAVEANLASFFIISGTFYFIIGNSKSRKLSVLSAFLFGLSLWTYNSARIFTPLLFLFLLLIFRPKKRQLKYFTVTFLIFFIPMLIQLFSPMGSARYSNVQIIDEGTIAEIESLRNTTTLSPSISRLIYNRPVYFTKSFIIKYFSHFTPKFLYLNGGDNYQFNLQNHGLLYPISGIFLLLGILLLVKDFHKNKSSKLLITWMLLAPIAASLTRETPHTLRAITFLPTPMIISSLGVIGAYRLLSEKLPNVKIFFIASYILVLLFSFENYVFAYANDYKKDHSQSWQFGYKDAVRYINEKYDNYDQIIFTKKHAEPHEFILFYSKWDPQKYQADPGLIRFQQSNWYWVDAFDKFFFINDWLITKDSLSEKTFTLESGGEVNCRVSKCLLITSKKYSVDSWQHLKTINFLDQKPAFVIYENQ